MAESLNYFKLRETTARLQKAEAELARLQDQERLLTSQLAALRKGGNAGASVVAAAEASRDAAIAERCVFFSSSFFLSFPP